MRAISDFASSRNGTQIAEDGGALSDYASDNGGDVDPVQGDTQESAAASERQKVFHLRQFEGAQVQDILRALASTHCRASLSTMVKWLQEHGIGASSVPELKVGFGNLRQRVSVQGLQMVAGESLQGP